MNQKELLQYMIENTHTLWNQSFVDKVNEAFGTQIKCYRYNAGGGPKGLTLNDGSSHAMGLACFDLAPMLCQELGVRYEPKLGRGFQVLTCVAALREAGYGQT